MCSIRPLVLGLLLAACASGPAAPPPLTAVTDGARVVGYGQGPSPSEARNRAALDIATQLEAELSARDTVIERVAVRDGVASSALDATSAVAVTARFTHPDWIDVLSLQPVRGGYAAVSALDRRRAAAALLQTREEAALRLEALLGGPRDETQADGAPRDEAQAAATTASRLALGPEAQALRDAIVEATATLGAVTRRPAPLPAVVLRHDAARAAEAAQSPGRALGLCLSGGLPDLDPHATLAAAVGTRTARVGPCGEAGWRLRADVALSPRQDARLPEAWFCDASVGGTLQDPAGQTRWATAPLGGRATKSVGRSARDACQEALRKAAGAFGDALALP